MDRFQDGALFGAIGIASSQGREDLLSPSDQHITSVMP